MLGGGGNSGRGARAKSARFRSIAFVLLVTGIGRNLVVGGIEIANMGATSVVLRPDYECRRAEGEEARVCAGPDFSGVSFETTNSGRRPSCCLRDYYVSRTFGLLAFFFVLLGGDVSPP